nr:EOG090X0A8N [Eulimnadia texana]
MNESLNTTKILGTLLLNFFQIPALIRLLNCEDQLQLTEKSHYKLVIAIMSAPTKPATRQVIRETWLSQREPGVKHLFIVGTKNLNTEVIADIEEEQKTYNDIQILRNFSESYATLAEKVLASFYEIELAYNFDFLMKCDDDTYVHVPKLLYELEKKPQERLYWGYFKGGGAVRRTGKWKESSWFMCDTYLPYAYGGGYVLSGDLVKYVARNRELLQTYNNEDVSVGVWLSPLHVHRVHDVLFDTEYKSRGCFNSYVVTHKQSPSMMREKHKTWTASGKLCLEEKRERYSYVYNWTVPASQCCKGFYNTDLP